MAPKDFKQQTSSVIQCLFEEPVLKAKSLVFEDTVVADGVGDEEDSFDPVIIADKLRQLGDDYNEKVIKPHMDKFLNQARSAAAEQAALAFSDAVESLCKSWPSEGAEVRQEKYLLKASVTVGLYAYKKCPNLSETIQNVLTQFVETRLGSWIVQQGGWVSVLPYQ
uniref:BCL2 like 15 n=1 Tax=Lepisosteus oculatus TaxID=7918 RepID=W5MXP7_LEPOC